MKSVTEEMPHELGNPVTSYSPNHPRAVFLHDLKIGHAPWRCTCDGIGWENVTSYSAANFVQKNCLIFFLLFFLDGRKNGYVGGVEYFAATIRKYSLWDYQSWPAVVWMRSAIWDLPNVPIMKVVPCSLAFNMISNAMLSMPANEPWPIFRGLY